MILFILGIIDLIASISLIFSLKFSIVFYIGVFILLKGIYSLAVRSFFAGSVDVICGILLLLNVSHIIAVIFGVLLLIKALQSMIFGILG